MTSEQRFDQLFSVLMKHSETAREDAVASLFLRLRLDLRALDGPARALFAAFLQRALAGREETTDVLESVAEYFRQNPLPQEIAACIEHILDESAEAPIGDG